MHGEVVGSISAKPREIKKVRSRRVEVIAFRNKKSGKCLLNTSDYSNCQECSTGVAMG